MKILSWFSGLLPDTRAIRIACTLCLASLFATVWAVLHPKPLVVIFAMSVGQTLGVIGVCFYLFVVVRDIIPRLRKRLVDGPASRGPKPAPPKPPLPKPAPPAPTKSETTKAPAPASKPPAPAEEPADQADPGDPPADESPPSADKS
ncbi:MAG: hypothetical protein U0271_02565 [Polyangiaceae bacterium]